MTGSSERLIADAAREAESIWSRCTVWELTPAVCELGAQVAPLLAAEHLGTLKKATAMITCE